MSIINRIVFHFKKGTLLQAGSSFLVSRFKSSKDNPIGNNYVGEKAEIYDQHRENDPYWKAEDDCVKEYLDRIGPELQSVIDAPFGTGRFAPIYAMHKLKVVALDISSDMIEIARKKHALYLDKTEFLIQDMTKIPFPDHSIDLVICFRFIPWIISFQDAEIALAELSRVCKKYAVIELCIGTHESANQQIHKDKILWNKYNKIQLTNWLKGLGFEVLDVKFLYDDEQHPGLSAFFCKKMV